MVIEQLESNEFTRWTREFEAKARARAAAGDPDWSRGARLHPAITRSVQRFQVGESGDGADLIAKAERAGDPVYTAAVRLFVDEERNHARLLAQLLRAAGQPTIARHWTDAVFVWLRRALGLRLELMVLMVAEIVALQYYRALRDGTDDPLTTRVAALILDDERRHVPFHTQRLRAAFAGTRLPARLAARAFWWIILTGATLVVAHDHGRALRELGCSRTEFVRATLGLFATIGPTALRGRY
ncbi:ferritin-like domain-containing protein [Nocardia lijiangensis]|uniref:ferritin-like domain-containing protein n=1 Tax=Nocardia lijiangensis TaxID=299618 RepID=UPI000831B23C|nr:ferritin-like domain-containing protein [Nocardia lijiangensis]